MLTNKISESLKTIMSTTKHTEKYLINEWRQHYQEFNSLQLIISIKSQKCLQYRN